MVQIAVQYCQVTGLLIVAIILFSFRAFSSGSILATSSNALCSGVRGARSVTITLCVLQCPPPYRAASKYRRRFFLWALVGIPHRLLGNVAGAAISFSSADGSGGNG